MSALFVLLAGAGLFALFILAESAATDNGYQGYGSRTVGGAGGQVFWVDPTLGDPETDEHAGTRQDPCSLRKALAGGNRIVNFTRGGTITLRGDIRINDSCITIDGASAPAPGVTITHKSENHGALAINSGAGQVRDVIIHHLRFAGLWGDDPRHEVGLRLLGIGGRPTAEASTENIVFDHLSMCGLQDKTTFWGHVCNVTVSQCLFYDSYMATLVSFYNYPFDRIRDGYSFHHNVYARSVQRNPQLRGWIDNFNYVNNIVYAWEVYGMRIKNEPGERSINANVVNNLFLPTQRHDWALVYGWQPGPDYADRAPRTDWPQGTVYKDSAMGQLYVAGNILPPENRDQYSTIEAPLSVPDWAAVRTDEAASLPQTLLPTVGHEVPQ